MSICNRSHARLVDSCRNRSRVLKGNPDLMPSYGGLIEPSGPKLTLKNLRLVLKILYAGCLGLPAVISAQFALEMCVAAWNREKFTKTPILGVQSSSGSSMLVSWQEHVDYLHKKLRTFTNIFYKIQSRPKLKSDILKPFFFCIFYPHLLYGVKICGNTCCSYINKL